MSQIQTLADERPGWMSRLFEIEVGTLIACDAEHDGAAWVRREPFRFLYRSPAGHFYLLTDSSSWSVVDPSAVERLHGELPIKLVPAFQDLPAPIFNTVDAGEDRDARYRVVRNDAWSFSLLPRHLELPAGWSEIGFEGAKQACLDHIEAHCVFGASNPRLAASHTS
jgi:MbtH protein